MRLIATTFIAGTTIGAGMLALPITAFKVGFVSWFLMSVFFCIFMSFAGIVQSNLNAFENASISIAEISKKHLGRFFEKIAIISILGLTYSLLAAYATGASQILHESVFHFSFNFSLIVYVSFFAFFIASCFSFVDYLNRFLVVLKVIVFSLVVFLLINYTKIENIKFYGNLYDVFIAIPIFFTAFGFHASIPSLFGYLNKDLKFLKQGIFLGSFLALITYLVWQTVTLGCIKDVLDAKSTLGDFIHYLGMVSKSKSFENFIGLFTFFGVSTSFLGVGISLFEYIREKSNIKSSIVISIFTFLPPILFASCYPSGFVFALRFAAIFLSVIAVILPALNALKLNQGGVLYKIGLYLSLLIGTGIIIIDIVLRF